MNLLLALLCCNTCSLINETSYNDLSAKIVIVGAGVAGIAAAARLYENGFTNITILEAEDRIGGRIHSVETESPYKVDVGAQYIHGEKNNVAFELAEPLNLIYGFSSMFRPAIKYFDSSGSQLSREISYAIQNLEASVTDEILGKKDIPYQSFGEYAESRYKEFFNRHRELRNLHQPLLRSFELSEMISDGGDTSWHDISLKGVRNYAYCEGESNINWLDESFSTMLDILIKKYPNPKEELPVLKNTRKRSKVMRIDYNQQYDKVKVSTVDGKEYLADHIIFTPSLGVLKANYQRLFNPPLPTQKVTAIENIGFSAGGKIFLYYEKPWWKSNPSIFILRNIYWTNKDRQEIMQNPDKRWMLGVYGAVPVEFKSHILCLWVASTHTIEVELLPKDILSNQITELLTRFYGKAYNVTKPTQLIRSSWNSNENFLGTYSYASVAADMANVNYKDLAEPIIRDGKPVLQFAGEATSEHFSTVHGAIESGWREADRLINLYSTSNGLSQLLKKIR